MEEKTTKELMEEKQIFNEKIDEEIRISMLISTEKNVAIRDKLRADDQKKEDDGWNSSYINPIQPEPIMVSPIELNQLQETEMNFEPVAEVISEVIEPIVEMITEAIPELTELELERIRLHNEAAERAEKKAELEKQLAALEE